MKTTKLTMFFSKRMPLQRKIDGQFLTTVVALSGSPSIAGCRSVAFGEQSVCLNSWN